MSQIDLDDLHDPESFSGITLEMQDRSRYFDGRTGATKSNEPDTPVSLILFMLSNKIGRMLIYSVVEETRYAVSHS